MNHFGDKTHRLRKMAVLGLLGAILCPCTCPSIVPQEPTPEGQVETVGEEEIEETLEFLVGPSETPLGTFETYDLDNDGKEDRFVYSFSEEEVTEDLFLGRSIEYQEADYGYDGRIELRFENKGDEAVEYWHIEDIPKEFAESVDDLEFSVPPDEIIDPDPKVKSKVQLDRRTADETVESFLNIVKRSATTDLEETSHDLAKTTVVYQMRTLDRLVDEKDRDKRLLELARQFRREIAPKLSITAISNPEALAALCGRASNPAIYHACAAILTDDATRCDELKKSSDRDLCKALLIHARCVGIKDQKEREECYFQQAIDLGSELACLYVKDADKRQACLAAVRKKVVYDIESWFTAGEEARYEQLVPGFLGLQIVPHGTYLECHYWSEWWDDKALKGFEDRNWKVQLNIYAYANDADARERWRILTEQYSAEGIREIEEDMEQVGLDGYTRVSAEQVLLYVPERSAWDDTFWHNHYVAFLYGNCVVEIHESAAPEKKTERVLSYIDPVKALIDEKISADEQR